MTWLSESEAHDAAFRRVTDAWDLVGDLAAEFELPATADRTSSPPAALGEAEKDGPDGR